ncbi:response regulator transcription factor [Reyranella sp.]|uniref:response regulator transcription factor n=1 Tax=Reyranella sp. TaxID=1929291 RepID=UPI003D145C7F
MVAIADDDADVREALADLLGVVGLETRAFDRAEALLEVIGSGAFDCIVTDVRMPGMNGLQLLRRLGDLGASVPVIVITSDSDSTIRSRALAGGAHAHMVKPIEDRVLLLHLASALAGKWKGTPNG